MSNPHSLFINQLNLFVFYDTYFLTTLEKLIRLNNSQSSRQPEIKQYPDELKSMHKGVGSECITFSQIISDHLEIFPRNYQKLNLY